VSFNSDILQNEKVPIFNRNIRRSGCLKGFIVLQLPKVYPILPLSDAEPFPGIGKSGATFSFVHSDLKLWISARALDPEDARYQFLMELFVSVIVPQHAEQGKERNTWPLHRELKRKRIEYRQLSIAVEWPFDPLISAHKYIRMQR
jgi:hypothetical protein